MFERKKAFPPTPIANSFWIEPGRLLAGEYPGAPTHEETVQRLEALTEAGVTYFLNLTQPGELPGYDYALAQLRRDIALAGREPLPLVHRNNPLEDHGTPDSAELMQDILDQLERALGEGHLVYVHCRAGIGRTNLVIGCWMRRQGLAGAAAIKTLNRLWKANARSATWKRIPEYNQESYVVNWQAPLPADAGLSAHDRYLGALVGMACGDALGARVEGKSPGEFVPLTDMTGAATPGRPPGAWTDDTAMALCLAHSLLEKQGFDANDLAERLWLWHQEGLLSSTGEALAKRAAVSKALATARWSEKPFSGAHDPKRWEPESVSRSGVAALFWPHSPQDAIERGVDASRVTHQSPGILDACRFYTALMLAALSGVPKQDLALEAWRVLSKHHPVPLKTPVASLAQSAILPTNAPRDGAHPAAAALHRVLWVLSETDNFRDGLLRVVNLGGCSDVQGALFGQLAGAMYGIDAVPKAWRAALLRRDLLESTAQRLLSAVAARPR